MTPASAYQSPLSSQAALQVFCLPYAGGGAAPFSRWRKVLPAWVDLVPLTLPGHDGRLHEPPRTDLRSLAAELADDIRPRIDRPFAVLGHSMGAWLAFELVRALRRQHARLPELMFVAAARAPHFPLSESPIHLLADEELVEVVDRRYGGIPERVRNSPELLRLLLPSLRADLQMIETYHYCEEPPLDVEIVALGGTDDTAVSAAQLEGWRQHTTKRCSVRLVPGGHFFLFAGSDVGASMSRQTAACGASAALEMIVNRLAHYVPQASLSWSPTRGVGPGAGK